MSDQCFFIFQVFTSACYLLSDLYVPESAVNDDWDDGGSENGDTDDSEHSEVNMVIYIKTIREYVSLSYT